jgi:hypothetical protein
MNTRKAIFDSFVEKLEQHPVEGLTVAKQRMLAEMLTDVAHSMFKEQQAGIGRCSKTKWNFWKRIPKSCWKDSKSKGSSNTIKTPKPKKPSW